jgi:hypothetical protein
MANGAPPVTPLCAAPLLLRFHHGAWWSCVFTMVHGEAEAEGASRFGHQFGFFEIWRNIDS